MIEITPSHPAHLSLQQAVPNGGSQNVEPGRMAAKTSCILPVRLSKTPYLSKDVDIHTKTLAQFASIEKKI